MYQAVISSCGDRPLLREGCLAHLGEAWGTRVPWRVTPRPTLYPGAPGHHVSARLAVSASPFQEILRRTPDVP